MTSSQLLYQFLTSDTKKSCVLCPGNMRDTFQRLSDTAVGMQRLGKKCPPSKIIDCHGIWEDKGKWNGDMDFTGQYALVTIDGDCQ